MKQKHHRQYSFEGNCGQHALVHALGCLGINISIGEAHRRTGVSRLRAMFEGTDEHAIMKGIRRSGCKPLPHLVHGESKARKIITRYLRQGIPVIILIDEEEHWMVLSGMKGRKIHVDRLGGRTAHRNECVEDGRGVDGVWGTLAADSILLVLQREVDPEWSHLTRSTSMLAVAAYG